MIELPLVFVAGVLGSSHCIGMCGPFALTIGSASPNWRANLGRQAMYSLGRLFTYTVFGAAAGFGGLRLSQWVPGWANIPSILALLAGALLVHQGLAAAGVLGGRKTSGNGVCLSASLFASFLKKPDSRSLFLAGMFTGFLPCGLVYAFVALAASSASLPLGAATMAVFGLGTAPVMMLTGLGGSVLSLGARRQMFRIAAWSVVLAGAVSIARGASILHSPAEEQAVPSCPLCD